MMIERTFAAPVEAVFDAWTRPEHFAAWFGGDQVTLPPDRLDFDARPGASWAAAMALPDGATIDWAGEFVTVQRPRLFVFTLTDQPADPGRGTVRVELQQEGSGTRMTMTQTGGGLTDEQYEQAKAGWNTFIDVIERLVAS